jgi:hypothetical protein
MKLNGERHLSTQWYFRGVNWYGIGQHQDSGAQDPVIAAEPDALPGNSMERQVAQVYRATPNQAQTPTYPAISSPTSNLWSAPVTSHGLKQGDQGQALVGRIMANTISVHLETKKTSSPAS